MKKKFSLIFLAAGIALIWSCTKKNTSDDRDSFVASYTVTEFWSENSVNQSKPVFTMSVTKSVLFGNTVLLNNFANYGAGVTTEATVNGTEIVIPEQTLPNLKVVSGSGILADTTLTITYTETLGSTSFIVTATAKKR